MGGSSSTKNDQEGVEDIPIQPEVVVIICEICYVNTKDTRLKCDFNICQTGLSEWITVRITKDLLKADEDYFTNMPIPCPNSLGEHTITLSDMQNSFDKQNMQQIICAINLTSENDQTQSAQTQVS